MQRTGTMPSAADPASSSLRVSSSRGLRRLFAELRRRRVPRVVGAYGLAAVAAIAAASDILPAFRLPDWSVTFVAVMAVIGLPVVAALAWAFEWTPEGVRRDRGGSLALSDSDVATAGTDLDDDGKPAHAGAATPADAEPAGIAVLPFANLSDDPANEYFSDGITEDVIAQLSKIRGLRVTSRTSVMRYKGSDEDSREIGARLGVATLLEGSVRRHAGRVRVVAQLIDATRDVHLWSETYDRDLTDVFAIQSELALRVGEALRAHLSPAERDRVESRPTQDLEAYQLYLRGRAALNTRTGESIGRALRLFSAASTLDPAYAGPHAGLAEAYALLAMGFGEAPREALPEARAAAARALELDPLLPDAHASLGWVRLQGWEWAAAEESLRTALELNPSYAQAHEWYGYLCNATRRYPQGLAAFRRAHELDPLSVIIQTELGWPYGYMGRLEEADAQFRRALEMDPDYAMAHFDRGWMLLLRGDHASAVSAFQGAAELDPVSPFIPAWLGRTLAEVGRVEEARTIAADFRARAEQGEDTCLFLAFILEGLGEQDAAFESLERALKRHEGGMWLLGIDNLISFSPEFRAHPRFVAVLAEMGLPAEGPLEPSGYADAPLPEAHSLV
jgi:adenylate cyclase